MATFTWLKNPLTPSWFSAVGTISIAVVAFFTMGPIIENLKLKQLNKKLEDELITFQDQIHQAKQTLEIHKTETNSVKRSLDIAQKVLTSLNEQNARLDSANEKLIKNLEGREQERIELKKQIQELNQEFASLQSENTTFKASNKTLNEKNTLLIKQLENLSLQLTETKKSQRSFAIESIIIKAKSYLPAIIGVEGYFTTVPWDDAIQNILSKGTLFDYSVNYIRLKNGRDIMTSLFNSREFDLLGEIEARKLKQEILNYMDQHQKVFSEPISVDFDIISDCRKYLIGKYSIAKNTPSFDDDLKLKEECEKEIIRVKNLKEKIKSKLDEMLTKLV